MIDPKIVTKAVSAQSDTLQINYKMLDILEGNLEPYIIRNLERLLSKRVLNYAMERIVPINIVPRYVDKLSNIYQTGVMREVSDGTDQDFELVNWYEKQLFINQVMHQANRLYNACRSSLVHPYITEGGPKLRVIPNDRFVVVSEDPIDLTNPTMIILIAGRDSKKREIYWVYTKDEFAVIKSDASIDFAAMEAMGLGDGINPYGVLPFVYTNQSHLRLIPTPDIDTIRMAEYVPAALTDLNLAALFSSFSITYVKNGEISDPTYAPNALWFLKSDDPEKEVEIGTLKPEVDYQEVLNLIQSEMSLWLGSKGIKTGSVGALQPDSATSGIAKIIDEADTFDIRQSQTVTYSKTESQLWDMILNKMHPIWVSQGMVENRTIFSSTAEVTTRFSVVPVGSQRSQIIQEQRDEYAAGFTTRSRAIAALNPQMTYAQIEELESDIDEERGMPIEGAPEEMSNQNSDSIDSNNDSISASTSQTSIQDAVLNGAQVASAVEILTAAAIGQIPRDSAQALFEIAFQLDAETSSRLLSTIGDSFVPKAVKGQITAKPEVNSNGAAEGTN
jgi:hypothetical protein